MAKSAKEAKELAPKGIILPEFDWDTVLLRASGITPLLTNRFSEEAQNKIEDKQVGHASTGRKPRVPEDDYWNSLYHLEEGQTPPHKKGYRYGIPCTAFKRSAVSACTSLKGVITQTQALQAFHVLGDFAEIIHKAPPRMRRDTVRRNKVGALAYRAEFADWSVVLTIRYNACVLSIPQLISLFSLAGTAVGVGDWRPEKRGTNGMYVVGK